MELREPTVFVWRHGRTRFNKGNDTESRLKGTKFDLPLTDEGHDESEKAAQWLAQFDIASIKHSDMQRSSQTAAHLEKAAGQESKVAKWLDPWDVGYLSGHTREDAKRRIEYYIRNPHKTIPEGDSYSTFYDPFDDGLSSELKAAEKSHSSPTFKAHVLVTHSCNVAALPAVVNQEEPQFHSEHKEQPRGNHEDNEESREVADGGRGHGRAGKPMIRIFTLDPKYPLDEVVEDLKAAKDFIASYKSIHPDIDVYWHPVHKA